MEIGESYTKTRSGWVDSEFYQQAQDNALFVGFMVAFFVGAGLWGAFDYLLICLFAGYWVQDATLPTVIVAGIPTFYIAAFIAMYVMFGVAGLITYFRCRRWAHKHPRVSARVERVGEG